MKQCIMYKSYHVLSTYHINNCVYIHTTLLCFYYFSSVTKQRRQMKTKLLHQSLISCPHLNQNVQKRRFLLLAVDEMHSKAGKSFFNMGGHYQKSCAFSQREGCMYIRVSTIWEILEILKGESISLKFWLKIFGKLVSDLL